MAIAVVLAVIDGAPGSVAGLAAATELGRSFSSRVELLHVEADLERSVPMVAEGMSGVAVAQVLESLQAEAKKRLAEARRLYETHCVQTKLSVVEPDAAPQPGRFTVAFRTLVGDEAGEVVARGRLADLIVMARPGEEDEAPLSPTFDAALFESGRPVVLVPAKAGPVLAETIAVGWDGSRQAARAVAAALPILAKAKRVVVLSGRESDETAEPSALARYLAAHGIEARTWAFAPKEEDIGEALLAEAAKANAGLLVMGAYGHSRLRELVLGGATRAVLAKAGIPILMVH